MIDNKDDRGRPRLPYISLIIGLTAPAALIVYSSMYLSGLNVWVGLVMVVLLLYIYLGSPVFGSIGLGIGIVAFIKYKAHRWASSAGILLALVNIVVFLVFMVPAFKGSGCMRMKAWDGQAIFAGMAAREAQEIYFKNNGGTYTDDLQKLIEIDEWDLKEADMFLWEFGECNSEGFTFTTWSEEGTGLKFEFSSEGRGFNRLGEKSYWCREPKEYAG